MEALRELNEELGNPSAAKLYQAALKRKIKISKQQAETVAKEDSVREVFAKPAPQRGAHATNEDGAIVQIDLIDLKEQGEKFKFALVVTEVLSRKTYSAPLVGKTQEEVWAAFDGLLKKMPKKPTKVDTDGGPEFMGTFAENAESRGMVVQTKNSDPNGVAVNDASIQSIKSKLFREMARKGESGWSDKLGRVTASHNKSPHETLYGESPEGVASESVVKFRLMQDNAEKLKENSKQLGQRQKRLMEAGAFRPQLPKTKFQRSFKPRYSGEVKTVDRIEGGTVVATGGQRYDIARVLPVSKDSKNIDWRPEGNARQEMRRFVAPLKKFLEGDGAKSITAASTHMRTVPGFEAAMEKFRLDKAGGFKQFVQLFDSDFEVQGPESGPGQRTIRVRRRKLVGKQKA